MTDTITAARQVSLTTAVITEWAHRGTPKQREYLHGYLQAEHASRQHATRLRLLKAARLPVTKTLDGYDWSAIRFPDGYGRDALTSLEFIDHAGDLVFYGDVGTGKTHLAAALVAAACHQHIPARFFTTAALVFHLRRAKDTDRLESQLAAIGKNRLIVIDEFALPTHRPRRSPSTVPSHLRGLRETQPHPHHQPRILSLDHRLRRRPHGSRRHRPHHPPRPPPAIRQDSPTASKTPS